MPHYESLRDQVVAVLETIGFVRGARGSAAGGISQLKAMKRTVLTMWILDTSTARKNHQDAEHELSLVKKEKETAERELSRLFDEEWYGKEGEWKKLVGLCLEKDTGECVVLQDLFPCLYQLKHIQVHI